MQQRSRFKRTQSLEERLAQEAKRLREEAKLLPPGALREELIRKARHAENSLSSERVAHVARPSS